MVGTSREELGAVISGGVHIQPSRAGGQAWDGMGWDGRKEAGTQVLGWVTPMSPLVMSQVQAAALCSEMST